MERDINKNSLSFVRANMPGACVPWVGAMVLAAAVANEEDGEVVSGCVVVGKLAG